MARKLKTIARWINENLSPDLTAEVEKSHLSTDVKVGRYRIPKKGYDGYVITIRDGNGNRVHSHNSAEPYNRNADLELWLNRWLSHRAVTQEE